MGSIAAAKTAQALMASGESREPLVIDKRQKFKFGGDSEPIEAPFAVSLPVTIGKTRTWKGSYVLSGFTPHLVSRRWLSTHKCKVKFDPEDLYLQSTVFGKVPFVLHTSGHLLLSSW